MPCCALTLSGVSKTYPTGIQALNDVNLRVSEGDFFALLGPNGAGKTTLIGIITSLVRKTEGSIEVFGINFDQQRQLAKAQIGLVPQEMNCSIFEEVMGTLLNQAGYYGITRQSAKISAEFYLKKMSLWDKRHARVRDLSGGMRRRFMIARALIVEPKLLLLDEPTAGVDVEIRQQTWDFLREINQKGTTILLTTHYLEEAENLCNQVAIINHGHILTNTPMAELLSQLTKETVILYLDHPLKSTPNLAGYTIRLVDKTTLEADLSEQQSLQSLFHACHQAGIAVNRLKNKTNRLESLFLNLVRQK